MATAATEEFEDVAARVSGEDLDRFLHRLAAHAGQAGEDRGQRAWLNDFSPKHLIPILDP